MKKRVVLLVGGLSAEREVSLSTGKGFEKALQELGYPHEVVDAKEDLLERLTKAKADVALIALHGKYAEDGIVQSICEYLKLPYTGSGVLASALCMDKIFTKEVLVNHDIPTPKHQICDLKKVKPEAVQLELKLPVVVKPSREGSSVGVSIVKEKNDFLASLKMAGEHDHYIIIEEYIPGLEITVPILNDRALTPIEIAPKVDFYDYKNKYTAGRTDYHLPPRVDGRTIELIKDHALKAYHACRVRGYGRIDFRVNPEGQPYVIEINTLPGCTPTSLLPKSAAHEGIGFNEIVRILVETATLDYAGVK